MPTPYTSEDLIRDATAPGAPPTPAITTAADIVHDAGVQAPAPPAPLAANAPADPNASSSSSSTTNATTGPGPGVGTLDPVSPLQAAARTAEPYAVAAGGAAAAALVPELEAPAIALNALRAIASTYGAVGARHLSRMIGGLPKPTPSENATDAVITALPFAVGHVAERLALSPEEEDLVVKNLRGERTAPPRPIPTELPAKAPKPGAPPTAAAATVPGEAPAPDVGIIPQPPLEASVGRDMSGVGTQMTAGVQKESNLRYEAERSAATRLGLTLPSTSHIAESAAGALDKLNESGLDPSQKDAARKVLEAIRTAAGGETAAAGDYVKVNAGASAAPTPYATGLAWKKSLRDLASDFSETGNAKSFRTGAVDRVLREVNNTLRTAAQGTEVADAARTADEYFASEVIPTRKMARVLVRGETEPNALVAALSAPGNEQKFARFMNGLDASQPELAAKVRSIRFNQVQQRFTDDAGRFDIPAFKKWWQQQPTATRASLAGGQAGAYSELFDTLEQVGAARTGTQAILDEQHAAASADAASTLQRAQIDYQDAQARYDQSVAARGTVRLDNLRARRAYQATLDDQQSQLEAARQKLASQQALVKLPAQGYLAVKALQSLAHGNVTPAIIDAVIGTGFSRILAKPSSVVILNRIVRAGAAGASPNVIARFGLKLAGDVVGDYATVLFPAAQHNRDALSGTGYSAAPGK